MRTISPPPNIAVLIGRELRVYYAYVTTAGPELDGPSTVTLYTATLTELSGFAADPIVHETERGRATTRLVLIDLKDLGEQRTRYRAERCIVAPADPMLVSPRDLQHWLWQRLKAPIPTEAHA